MKISIAILCLLLSAGAAAQPADVAIRGATIVDVTSGLLVADQTVLIAGTRIIAIGPSGEVMLDERAEVIDGEGSYLIPGLWDTHVHSAGSLSWHFPLYIAHGVTSVRNMHTTFPDALDVVLAIKRRVEIGELLGPRFLANGAVIDGDPPVWPGSAVVRNAEEARAAVDRLADGGADFIKVYDRLGAETYFEILTRAKERGIPVDGHVPFLIPPEEAAAAGQRTFEHTSGMTLGCAAGADVLRADYARYLERVPEMPPYPDQLVAFFRLVRRAIDARDPELCRQAARTFREYDVASVPTLVANGGTDPQRFVADVRRMALLPDALREEWQAMAEGPDPIGEVLGPDAAGIAIENVRVLHEEGVTILAGTDVGNPFLIPGLSLHRELEKLVQAGLTPLEALQAATINPARVFGMTGSLGMVEPGKLADLVLLDGNPLEDIRNTRRIRAVVADGRLYRRTDLDRLLAGVEQSVRMGAHGASSAQQLPPGGTTSWEIREPEEIVTFVLFDPSAPGVSLPAGLRFVSARDARMPAIQEHLKEHPEHAEWAFSFIEITRQKAFLIDGKEPTLPENGGIGLWFAPVDPSPLAEAIPKEKFDSIVAPSIGAVVALGFWIPDREYVAYMRARGHHAEYGMVTLARDSTGAFHGEIRLDDLHVRASALPHGDAQEGLASGTQVLFAPGEQVGRAVVVAGANARHLDCTAEWSLEGIHPLSRGVLVGPTYFTTYEAPLRGSAYSLRDINDR